MDPYLEHPALFPSVHQGMIGAARAALNAALPPSYVADIGERLYVVQPERDIYPDVFVVEQPRTAVAPASAEGGTAVAVASDPPWIVTFPQVEMREVFIQILSVADQSQVVAVIEVLSSSNKATSSVGRRLYLTKQK
jgi:hypothetical protein